MDNALIIDFHKASRYTLFSAATRYTKIVSSVTAVKIISQVILISTVITELSKLTIKSIRSGNAKKKLRVGCSSIFYDHKIVGYTKY